MWQSEKAEAASLPSSPSVKVQRGEEGWSEMFENKKGDMGLVIKDMWSKGHDVSKSRSKSIEQPCSSNDVFVLGGKSWFSSSGSDIFSQDSVCGCDAKVIKIGTLCRTISAKEMKTNG